MWLCSFLAILCYQRANAGGSDTPAPTMTEKFNGTDFLPKSHACYDSQATNEYTYFDTNDKLEKCDVILSPEATSFLIMSADGTLELFDGKTYDANGNPKASWRSCYGWKMRNQRGGIHGEQVTAGANCHEKVPNSYLEINVPKGVLTIVVGLGTQKRILWTMGFDDPRISDPDIKANSLKVTDAGDAVLLTRTMSVLWTTQFLEVGSWKDHEWHLIVNQNCTASGRTGWERNDTALYFNNDTARQWGAPTDDLYSALTDLTDLKYQIGGTFTFKMTWPDDERLAGYDLVWTQTSNPSATYQTEGFGSLMDPWQNKDWGGLHLSGPNFEKKWLLNGGRRSGSTLPIVSFAPPGDLVNPTKCLKPPHMDVEKPTAIQLWVKRGKELPLQAGQSEAEAALNIELMKGELQVLFDESYHYPESDDSADWPVIAIRRILGKDGEVDAFCVTQDGTAVQGEDFLFMQKRFKWRDQQAMVKEMRITIIDDDKFEFEEYFTVHCESLTADVLISQSEMRVTIEGPNDVQEGYATFNRSKALNDVRHKNIWISENQNLTVPVIAPLHDDAVTIRYNEIEIGSTQHGDPDELLGYDGDGYQEVDYVQHNGTLFWGVGDNDPKNLTIQIIDDDVWELDECFWIRLWEMRMVTEERMGFKRAKEKMIKEKRRRKVVHDKLKVCIRDDDNPGNCTDNPWGNWSLCENSTFGIIQVTRFRMEAMEYPEEGLIVCERENQTEECIGGISRHHPAKIMFSEPVLNISENGILHNLSQFAEVNLSLSTVPVPDLNESRKHLGFIEMESIVEVHLLLDPRTFLVVELAPSFLAWTNETWDQPLAITVQAINNSIFTAIEVDIKVEFGVKSLDSRFHELAVDPYWIKIWDDDWIAPPPPEPYNPWMDPKYWAAGIALFVATFWFIGNLLWRRHLRRKEWKSHNLLKYDKLEEELMDAYDVSSSHTGSAEDAKEDEEGEEEEEIQEEDEEEEEESTEYSEYTYDVIGDDGLPPTPPEQDTEDVEEDGGDTESDEEQSDRGSELEYNENADRERNEEIF